MNTTTKPRRSGAKIMAQLIVLLGSLAYIMLLAVINGTAGFLCAMGVTLSGAAAIAKALGEEISLSYGALIALAVGCGVLRGLLRFAEQYGNHYIAFRLLAVLRDKIFTALRRLCPAKLETRQKGAIIAMITSDIETLEVFYAHTISPICIAVLLSVGMTVFIGCVSSWYLALAAAAGYVTIGVLVPLVFSRRVRVAGQAYRAEFSSFSAYFLDSIRGIRDIVLHNAGAQRAAEVGRRSEVLLAETKKMKHETARAAAGTELCVSLFILAGLAVGTALTVTGERVLDLLEEESAVREVEEGEGEKIDGFAHLSADGVTFSYDGVTNVLSDVWMYAERGEIVGIVGESGCGKSTFLKLLLRFWQKQGGEILYNGADIDAIETASLLDNVTMVSQTTYLFDETIEENLRIARPGAARAEIEEACRLASIHDFILSLPEGYETRVGALGDNLSTGEKQRLGLARALLRGNALILLDEPTSNVDSINEGIILQALRRLRNKKGIILVSHRESTMAIADRVYGVKNGRMFPLPRAGREERM